ncbi:uncharacterized protein [Vulpes vulpes]|uniref:Collagen alpha-1(I) chain-like n=1 Tax=Vulpes vulpes TaxID=9627 RepID=A0ABM5AVJ8_VULVU
MYVSHSSGPQLNPFSSNKKEVSLSRIERSGTGSLVVWNFRMKTYWGRLQRKPSSAPVQTTGLKLLPKPTSEVAAAPALGPSRKKSAPRLPPPGAHRARVAPGYLPGSAAREASGHSRRLLEKQVRRLSASSRERAEAGSSRSAEAVQRRAARPAVGARGRAGEGRSREPASRPAPRAPRAPRVVCGNGSGPTRVGAGAGRQAPRGRRREAPVGHQGAPAPRGAFSGPAWPPPGGGRRSRGAWGAGPQQGRRTRPPPSRAGCRARARAPLRGGGEGGELRGVPHPPAAVPARPGCRPGAPMSPTPRRPPRGAPCERGLAPGPAGWERTGSHDGSRARRAPRRRGRMHTTKSEP